jgi:hypothetical protein
MSTPFRRSVLGALLALSLAMTGLFHVATLAQDVPSQIGPIVPQASSCTVEPRTTDELIALFSTASPDDPVVIDMSATIIVGETADLVSAQHVTSTIHQAFACLNAGDFGRFFSLLTDGAIVKIFPWMAEVLADEATADEALAPQPPGEEHQQTILGIGSIAQLPDGRYSAVVVGIDPSGSDAPFALYLILTESDGTWLIDDAVEFDMEM